MAALARENSPLAMQQIIDIAADPQNDPRVRVVAWDIVLTRAWGKPREQAPEEAAKAPIDLSRLNAKELQALKRLTAKMRGEPVAEEPAPIQADEGIVVDD